MWPTLKWESDRVILIDQRKLPGEEVYIECKDHEEVAEAIETMTIRGAPAIGVAAAFGVALGIMNIEDSRKLDEEFDRISTRLKKTRPTARNLFWAIERMKEIFQDNSDMDLSQLKQRLVQEALAIESEDVEANKKIGFWGKDLTQSGDTILTHCNAGALATAGYGTALGVIRSAHEEGKNIKVIVNETRPFLQGSRLTCWELNKENIPVVLITDNMAGHLMQKGEISLIITGADRIARNGDTANKIGTYTMAVLAKEHDIPFYVAAPLNTVDFELSEGTQIPIEERDPGEVREIDGKCLTLENVKVRNPAFDMTPSRFISAIITEKGIARPPFERSLEEFKEK